MHTLIYGLVGCVLCLASCDKPKNHEIVAPLENNGKPVYQGDAKFTSKSGAAVTSSTSVQEDSDPAVRRTVEAMNKVFQLASKDIGAAIAECNTIMTNLDDLEPDGTRKYPPELFMMLSGKLREGAFGPKCLFDSEQSLNSLKFIAESDLEPSVKAHFLVLSSAATQGDPSASAKVLKAAVNNTPNQEALSSIVTDVASIDPKLAIQELSRHQWTPAFSKATARLYATYVMNDPENGSRAVNELPKDSQAYQWASAGVFQAIRGAEPEAGAMWRAQINDPDAAAFADSLTYMMKVQR
jgi:hypothetical protein